MSALNKVNPLFEFAIYEGTGQVPLLQTSRRVILTQLTPLKQKTGTTIEPRYEVIT